MADLPNHLRAVPMGVDTVSRGELAKHQRDRVIAKVTPIFAKRGYQASTVDDLLASGKVGVGNFYSLFEGKEDCFLACFERVVGEVAEAIEAAADAGADWDGRTYLGLKATLDFLCSEPLAARIVLVEAQSAGAEATNRYEALIDRAVEWLAGGRREHPDADDLPARFEQAAVAGLAFYLQQCLLEARRPSAEKLLAETSALMLEPIIGADRLRRVAQDPVAATR